MPAGEGWDVPAEVRGDLEFRWWRVSGNRLLTLLVLSETPLWYRGHYHRGSMVPCLGDGCKMCAEGIGAQLRYVVAAAECSSHRPGLMEVGQTVARELRDLAVRHDGMPGMVVEFTKYSLAKNSRMEIRLVEREESPWWREIDVPDIKLALRLQWEKIGYELPEFARSAEIEEPRSRAVRRFAPPVIPR